jgi:hypothetical protein
MRAVIFLPKKNTLCGHTNEHHELKDGGVFTLKKVYIFMFQIKPTPTAFKPQWFMW